MTKKGVMTVMCATLRGAGQQLPTEYQHITALQRDTPVHVVQSAHWQLPLDRHSLNASMHSRS